MFFKSFKSFQDDRDVEDDLRSSRSSRSKTDKNIEKDGNLVRSDRQLSIVQMLNP